MNELSALDIGRNAVTMSLMLAAPMLIVAMIVGLVIGVVQALTQINEVTLSFVPKILAVFGVLAIAGPWLISTMLTYTVDLFTSLPGMVR
jgi:flagellar biosynthetic protein FliQ